MNSSVGAPKKLDRIRRNPHVAIAFHTRAHAANDRPEYVLVQGRATLGPPVADFPGKFVDNWERLEPWRDISPLWKRWMRVYALRIEVRIAVERMIVWPDLACRGTPEVIGAPLPAAPPPPQDPPAKGTAPRIDHARAAKQASRLPDVLLGWVGADGFPVAIAAQIGATDERGSRSRPQAWCRRAAAAPACWPTGSRAASSASVSRSTPGGWRPSRVRAP